MVDMILVVSAVVAVAAIIAVAVIQQKISNQFLSGNIGGVISSQSSPILIVSYALGAIAVIVFLIRIFKS